MVILNPIADCEPGAVVNGLIRLVTDANFLVTLFIQYFDKTLPLSKFFLCVFVEANEFSRALDLLITEKLHQMSMKSNWSAYSCTNSSMQVKEISTPEFY